MDPLSLTASLLATIHAVHVGGRQLAKLKSYYNAPHEIARLKAELVSLGQLLENVHDFVKGDSGPMARYSNDVLSTAISRAATRIDSINKILSSPAFGIVKLSDANKARLTLLRYKSRLAGLEKEVQESIQDLGVRLSLISA